MQGFDDIQSHKKSHALKRLLERFGLMINDEEYNNIVYDIEEYNNKPIFINDEDGKSFHLVKINNDECVFLYDWDYKCLLTVYYKCWFRKDSNGSWERRLFRPKAKHVRYKNRLKTLANKTNSDIEINMFTYD